MNSKRKGNSSIPITTTGHIVSPQPQIPTHPCKGIVYRSADVTMYAITVSRPGNAGNPPQQQTPKFPCYVCQKTTQNTRIHVVEGSGYLQTFFFCLTCIGNGSARQCLCRNEMVNGTTSNSPRSNSPSSHSYIRMPSPTVSYVGA